MAIPDPEGLDFFEFLHENNADLDAADAHLGDANSDAIAYHLRECKSVAVKQARKTFEEYQRELELAFNLDLNQACSLRCDFKGGVVDKVLSEFRQDVKDMTDTLVELTTFTQNVAARQEALKKRAEVSEQGQNRLRSAKIRVYEQVMQHTAEKNLPSAVLLFLFQPWSDYLCFTDLRFGVESDPFQQAVAVMDKLIWAVKPKHQLSDVTLQQQLREPLNQCIRAGLRTIRYDSGKTEQMMTALEGLLDKAANNETPAAAEPGDAEQLQAKANKKAYHYVPAKNPAEVLEREMLERLRKLEFGTVFRFADERRLRLAWYNARTSHFMMVDDAARKNHLMSGLELARALLGNKATIVSGEFRSTRTNKAQQPRKKHVIPGLHAACWGLF